MEEIDFSKCKFIKENMCFFTYYDFCNNCKLLKKQFQILNEDAQLFYKWYVYANIHMNEIFKNAIWDYLNFDDEIYYIHLIELKKNIVQNKKEVSMKQVTKDMIKIYNIKDFDFMGYDIKTKSSLSFHHLIVAHCNCKKEGLGDGYYQWNGAILVQNTSHNYLHLIENVDPEIFYLITSEMMDENLKCKLDLYNLRKIRELLLFFEKEHRNEKNSKGKILIKQEYIQNRFSYMN